MNIPTKKLTNNFEMPIFGLGTWQVGGRDIRDPNNDDQKDILAIQEAIHLGVTHIDTAESYADGYAETLVGQAIKGLDRKKLFLVSKIHKEHLTFDGVLEAFKNSIQRLKTDYLDLYLIHSPSLDIPIQETMKALDKLVKDGVVKNIGVSNFKTSRLIEAQKYTQNKIVVNQVYYNLIVREPERDGLLKYCQENDVILEAYRPLDKGAMVDSPAPILAEIAKKYNKTPAQVAINWLTSQDNVVTLSKSSNLNHLKENLGAIGWQMDSKDIEALRENFPNQISRSEALPLK